MENLEREDFQMEKVLAEIEAECDHPYHNVDHTRDVIDRVQALAEHVIPPLSDEEQKILVRAALFHDYGHPGKTIRQTSSEDVPRRDLSNEEYAAEIADERYPSGSNDERATLRKLILATSFGQDNPDSPFYRSYKAETRLEKILALADIGGFTKGFEKWIEEGLRVLQEADKDKMPSDFEAWKKGRWDFLNHIRSRVKALESDLDPTYFLQLTSELDTITQEVEENLESFREKFESVKRVKINES